MDVSLTAEQEMLVEAVRTLARDHAPGRTPDGPGDDTAVWAHLAEMGLLELRVLLPDEAADGGGPGSATGVEAALVAEALAYHLVAAPYIGVTVATELLVRAGARVDLVAEVAAGGRRMVPVLDLSLSRFAAPYEPGIAWDAAGADAGLVVDGAGELWCTPLGPTTPSAADLTRAVHSVPRPGPGGPVGERVGRLDDAGRQRAEALLLTLATADLLGVAAGALDQAVAHVAQRVQFERPVGSFQAVQHLCADAVVAVEASRSALWHAAWAVDELPAGEALVAARTAKAFAAAELVGVCETAVQLHGGIGMTWESLVHVHLRRALLDRAVLGDEAHQLDLLAPPPAANATG